MEKINIRDFTFLIPIRIDSVTRLENTLVSIDYILSHYNTNINIIEATARNTGILEKLVPPGVEYIFQEDLDNIFHRTRYINQLARSAKTEFISVWDSDIIIPVDQIIKSVNLLRNEEADFISPYKDRFLDTSDLLRDLYIQTRDIKLLEKHQGKMRSLYNPNPVGGAFFAKKDKYIESGMENERLYGWGREDGERVNRWKILGYRHQHLEGVLYHLSHERGINSKFHSTNQDSRKMEELSRHLAMSKEELWKEIKGY